MFQSLIILSYDPLARIVPSLLKVTEVINCSCPSRSAIHFYSLTSQSLIVVSYDPLAKIVPVLLKATEFIYSLWPNRVPI